MDGGLAVLDPEEARRVNAASFAGLTLPVVMASEPIPVGFPGLILRR
jgi:hypothetical protein